MGAGDSNPLDYSIFQKMIPSQDPNCTCCNIYKVFESMRRSSYVIVSCLHLPIPKYEPTVILQCMNTPTTIATILVSPFGETGISPFAGTLLRLLKGCLETAQFVCCSSCQHEDLSSPKMHMKKCQEWCYPPISLILKQQRQVGPWSMLANQSSLTSELQAIKRC